MTGTNLQWVLSILVSCGWTGFSVCVHIKSKFDFWDSYDNLHCAYVVGVMHPEQDSDPSYAPTHTITHI